MAASYVETRPTVTDAFAVVRRAFRRDTASVTSPRRGHATKQRFALPTALARVPRHATGMAKIELGTRSSVEHGGAGTSAVDVLQCGSPTNTDAAHHFPTEDQW